jgi:nicotinamidase/pyrazinamidase
MSVLIVVDMQNDFMPWGSLPVRGGDEIIPTINRLMERFKHVVATQDWHPQDHVSFAMNHGKRPGETVRLSYGEQILWPIHCVKDTLGADFVSQLKKDRFEKTFHKGVDPQIDSYSTFFDNARKKHTGLEKYLRGLQAKELFFAGVATDYCVKFSVLDALDLGFSASVFVDACRPVNRREDDEEKAIEEMKSKGAKIMLSSD